MNNITIYDLINPIFSLLISSNLDRLTSKGGVVMQDAKKIVVMVLIIPPLVFVTIAALVNYFSG